MIYEEQGFKPGGALRWQRVSVFFVYFLYAAWNVWSLYEQNAGDTPIRLGMVINDICDLILILFGVNTAIFHRAWMERIICSLLAFTVTSNQVLRVVGWLVAEESLRLFPIIGGLLFAAAFLYRVSRLTQLLTAAQIVEMRYV